MTTATEKLGKIKKLNLGENSVIVVAAAKAGTHLVLSILDALGVDRAEELGQQDGIGAQPFMMQHRFIKQIISKSTLVTFSLEAYDKMEQKTQAATKPINLPHTHLWPEFFPENFRGKIIHVTRDPRAVAASAFPFLKQIPPFHPYLNGLKLQTVDDYARMDAQGLLPWGRIKEFDEAWLEYAHASNCNFISLRFEDIIKDKPLYIKRVADFLNIKQNLDMEKV